MTAVRPSSGAIEVEIEVGPGEIVTGRGPTAEAALEDAEAQMGDPEEDDEADL